MKEKRLSGNALKLIACLSMLTDHAAKAFALSGAAKLVMSGVIGRLAFPLFCFSLTEGFFHTKNIRAYLGRMLLAAAVSEVLFDLTLHRHILYFSHQNTIFTLFAGLCMFTLLRKTVPLLRPESLSQSLLPD